MPFARPASLFTGEGSKKPAAIIRVEKMGTIPSAPDPEVYRFTAGMFHNLGPRPRKGARIVAPGFSPGVSVTNYEEPRRGVGIPVQCNAGQ